MKGLITDSNIGQLNLVKIGKDYGGKQILEDVSFSIEKGEILSILGPSGCGKTTLLNMILGLENVSQGKIYLSGQEITKQSMTKRGFNIVFQDYALFPHLTVEKNITYALKNDKNLANQDKLDDLIDLLDLRKHLKKSIDQLSGGQKQRVALARTLVMKPKILLLDEPLSALDGIIKENIKERIMQISKQLDLTTIIVTHDPEEALTMSDKVLILEEGKISQFGSPQEIINQPANDFVRDFIIKQLSLKKDKILTLFGGNYA